MKKIILAFTILSIALIDLSCKKARVIPEIDPTRAYTIKYNNEDQIVKTRISNDTLRMDFYQKINFLLDPDEYANTWALYLKQDFTKSYLKDLHYDAIANAAGYAHDWVPVDLNTVAPGQKTISNVTVNGKKYVQVSLTRVFEFYNKMGTNQAAINQQNTLLQTTTDVVVYQAFYAYNNIYSLSNDGTFKIVYTK